MAKWLYVIDHPSRDLPAYAWWAFSDFHTNSEVLLISQSELTGTALFLSDADIVVWNYARPNNIRLIKYSHSLGKYNIIHDTEGIHYNLAKYFANLQLSDFSAIDEIWLWGHTQLSHLKKMLSTKPGSRTNLRVTGSIRYEYIKHLPKTHLISTTKQPLLLWNTSYPLLAPKYQTLEKEFNELINTHKYFSEEEALHYLINLCHLRSSAFTQLQHFFSSKDPQFSLRIRPHPFERHDFYYPLTIENSNICLSSLSDLHLDLNDVTFVLHSGCQSVLDCFIRGIPSFVFTPSADNVWSKCSPLVDFDAFKSTSTLSIYLESAYAQQISLFKSHNIDLLLSNLFLPINLTNNLAPLDRHRRSQFHAANIKEKIKSVSAKLKHQIKGKNGFVSDILSNDNTCTPSANKKLDAAGISDFVQLNYSIEPKVMYSCIVQVREG